MPGRCSAAEPPSLPAPPGVLPALPASAARQIPVLSLVSGFSLPRERARSLELRSRGPVLIFSFVRFWPPHFALGPFSCIGAAARVLPRSSLRACNGCERVFEVASSSPERGTEAVSPRPPAARTLGSHGGLRCVGRRGAVARLRGHREVWTGAWVPAGYREIAPRSHQPAGTSKQLNPPPPPPPTRDPQLSNAEGRTTKRPRSSAPPKKTENVKESEPPANPTSSPQTARRGEPASSQWVVGLPGAPLALHHRPLVPNSFEFNQIPLLTTGSCEVSPPSPIILKQKESRCR